MSKNILQFKITLNDSVPRIWRRIQIPESYTFWDLHCAIQDAMGWGDGHLHAFYMADKKRGGAQFIHIQMPNPEWDSSEDLDESKELVANWFPKKLKQCVHTYDFGDSWDHTILFERSIVTESRKRYPICIAGANACPFEDCGGVGGYMHLISVINDPKSQEGKELREWMGLEKKEIYDPTDWKCEDVSFENPKKRLEEYLSYQE
jgi:hypothetical protein